MTTLSNQARDILNVISIAQAHGITPSFAPLTEVAGRMAATLDAIEIAVDRLERADKADVDQVQRQVRILRAVLDEDDGICDGCGHALAYFAGPGTARGRVCMIPSCDLYDGEMVP